MSAYSYLGDHLDFRNGKSSPPRLSGGAYCVYGSNGPIGQTAEYNADANTIIVGRVGSYCGSIHYSNDRCWVTDNAIVARAKQIDEARFWYFFLAAADLNSHRAGSGQPLLNQSILNTISVQVPDHRIRIEIGDILGALDDKIQLNRQMNESLEAMARALFQDWFVDFGPTRAKLEGRAPYLAANIWSLFPDQLDDGGRPEGWVLGAMSDLLTLQRGFDLPSQTRNAGPHPIIAASGPNGFHDTYMVKGPGVTTGRSGVLGNVYFIHEDFWPLNTSLWVKEYHRATPSFAYFYLSNIELATFNAGSAVPTLNRNHIHGLPTVLPPKEIVTIFDELAMPLLQRQRHNVLESDAAAITLNLLLPKLMSGEIRINDAERIVGTT
jgi:type I restriction enzyme, S subunit